MLINLDYIYTMDLIRHLLVYNAYEGESAEKSILNGWLNQIGRASCRERV